MSYLKPRVIINFFYLPLFVLAMGYAIFTDAGWNFWLGCFLISYLIITFGVGFTYHRIFCHRAADIYVPVKNLGLIIGALSNTGSPVTWYVNHGLHHSSSDEQLDPHSPQFHGVKILFGFFSEKNVLGSEVATFHLMKKLHNEKFASLIHKYYYGLHLLYFLLLFSLGGFKYLVFFGLLPMMFGFFSVTSLNYLNHLRIGYRNFDLKDESRNFWPLFFINFGENWHNNHHARPVAKSTKLKWWEFDPTSVYFLFFERKRTPQINKF